MTPESPSPMPDKLIITYLEMTSRGQFQPGFVDDPRMQIVRMMRTDLPFYLFLYREVGYAIRWRDRLVMSAEALRQALERPGVSVYVLWVEGTPAGYIELVHEGTDTEIAYFGLRDAYQGRGYGRHLLSFGIQQAWDDGANRVWVHTCNLDGPHALENYVRRGLMIYQVEEEPMPDLYRT